MLHVFQKSQMVVQLSLSDKDNQVQSVNVVLECIYCTLQRNDTAGVLRVWMLKQRCDFVCKYADLYFWSYDTCIVNSAVWDDRMSDRAAFHNPHAHTHSHYLQFRLVFLWCDCGSVTPARVSGMDRVPKQRTVL